jgi:hypothetical protein
MIYSSNCGYFSGRKKEHPPSAKLPLARKFPGKRKYWALAILWQEKCQEILFGRKLTGNTMNCQDNGRKF